MSFTDWLSGILSSPEFAAFVILVLTSLAGWVAKNVNAFLGEKLTAEQLRTVMVVAQNAVRVAEQTGLGKTGEEKKAEAMRVAQTYLDAYGIKIDAERLASAIESAVYSELTEFKPLELPEEVVPSGEAAE